MAIPPGITPDHVVKEATAAAPDGPVMELRAARIPAAAVDGDDDAPIRLEALEIDLSEALAGLAPAAPVFPAPAVSDVRPHPETAAGLQDLEAVFEGLRARASGDQQTEAAREEYERGLARLGEGEVSQAMGHLQSASRSPALRFAAASQLGRLHIARNELAAAVEWLERAAEAPAHSPDEGFAVLYDLADTLERIGETARALAILMELDADAGEYRDVRARIAQLTHAQAGDPGA